MCVNKSNGQELIASNLSTGDFSEVTRKAIEQVIKKLDDSKFARNLQL